MSQAKIDHIQSTLEDMAFKDIEQASAAFSKMGAFILGSCFINCMAGFVCGREARGNHYKDFVRAYLPSYDPEKLWKDLRCALVHNYTEGGSYVFVDNQQAQHGQPAPNNKNKTIINLENFVDDLRNAMRKLLHEIKTDDTKQQLAFVRYDRIGLFIQRKTKRCSIALATAI
jgi:hypothetical protein